MWMASKVFKLTNSLKTILKSSEFIPQSKPIAKVVF